MIFDKLDPIVLRFLDVERHFAQPKDPTHQRIVEVVGKALEGIELTFQESDPSYTDPQLTRELISRFGKNCYESVFHLKNEENEWFLKRGLMHRVNQVFTGVEERVEKPIGSDFPRVERIVGSYYHCYNNIFRVVMNAWLEEVNQKYGFEIIIPREYLVPLPFQDFPLPNYLQYVVVAEKVEILEGQEVVDTIQRMPLNTQVRYIDYLASWISKTGFLDCHFKNIGFSKTEEMWLFGERVPKFVVVDSEPFGLITEESDHPKSLVAPGEFRERLTRSEAAYIGLMIFQKELKDKGFDPQVQRIAAGWVEKTKIPQKEEDPKPIPRKRFFRLSKSRT